MGDMTKNFSVWEFSCPCCLVVIIKVEFVERLQKVRDKYGPLKINSGFRCEKHNKEVGGKPKSSHRKGWAADIACPNSYSRFQLIRDLMEAGFKRIGIGRDFIHADEDPDKPAELMWLY